MSESVTLTMLSKIGNSVKDKYDWR